MINFQVSWSSNNDKQTGLVTFLEIHVIDYFIHEIWSPMKTEVMYNWTDLLNLYCVECRASKWRWTREDFIVMFPRIRIN